MSHSADNTNRRNIFGFILVLVGLAFLFRNLGFWYIPSFIFSWKTIVITIGVIFLATGKRDGWILVAIGGFFLITQDILHIYLDFGSLWPLILILVGIGLIIRHRKQGTSTSRELDSPQIDEIAVFSGLEKKVTSDRFEGGKTTAIFGGAEIDLRKATLSPHKNVIDIVAMFGAASFIVPSDWTINISQLTVVFGGFSDDRVVDTTSADPTKVLHIKGLILFGGGELKNG